ncbi:MAG: hypothetical protein WEC59_09590 [Salibacteraceae bacterium]
MKPLIKCVSWGIFFLLTGFQSQGQVIMPGEFIEGTYPGFNASIIKEKQIKELVIRQMRKPSGAPIYDDGKRAIYRFDKNGMLIHFSLVFQGHHKMDTTHRMFEYVNGKRTAHEIHRGRYIKRIESLRKNDSTIIESRLVRRLPGNWELLDREEIVTKVHHEDALKIVNEWRGGIDSKPYQKTTSHFDASNNIISREVWNGARLRLEEKWTYENGLIYTYEHQDHQEKTNFSVRYSIENIIQDEGEWCENENCKTWSIVYTSEQLPKGWIFMSKKSQNMEIWEFRYRY